MQPSSSDCCCSGALRIYLGSDDRQGCITTLGADSEEEQMDGEGFLRTENPRRILQAVNALILEAGRRQAPDEPIGLRYPIRVYQSGRSSIFLLHPAIYLFC